MKPFRLSKNGVKINLFDEHNEEGIKEENIPKVGYNPLLVNEENDENPNNQNLMYSREEKNLDINIINNMIENQPNNSI